MGFLQFLKRVSLLFVLIFLSCENELQEFAIVNYLPCEIENVIIDNNIINDFECQSNISLNNIETLRNPKEIQVNKSKFVGNYIKQANATEGINISLQQIDLTENSIFRIKVNTIIENSVLTAKLEGGTSGEIYKTQALIFDGGWVEYRFDFSEFANEGHNKFTLFFSSTLSTDSQFLIDDLSFEAYINPCIEIVKDLSIINDFDCQENVTIQEVSKVVNPFNNASNLTTFVGEYQDKQDSLDSFLIDYTSTIDLSVNNIFTINVYAPSVGLLKVKLKGGTSPESEREIQITTINQWTEYTFNFFNQNDEDHSQIEVFFNEGVTASDVETFYIDDIRFMENPCANTVFDESYFNDFDCQLNITPTGNTVSQIVSNPNINSNNESLNVLEVVDNGREPFDVLLFDNGNPINLSTKNSLKIKIHTSKEVPLIAKLEGGSSSPKEVSASINVVGDWKEYTFNFESEANANHNQLLLFFNAGQTNGTSLDTYYIDDVRFEASSSSQLDCTGVVLNQFIINDAECQDSYAIQGNASTQIIENPNKSGLNTSDFVVEVSDNGNDAWDFVLLNTGNSIDLSSNNILKIKVLSNKAVPFLAKLEGGTSNASEIWGSIDIVGNWAEYTFDFSSQASENHNSLVLFFNGGETNGSNPDTYYIDDLKWD